MESEVWVSSRLASQLCIFVYSALTPTNYCVCPSNYYEPVWAKPFNKSLIVIFSHSPHLVCHHLFMLFSVLCSVSLAGYYNGPSKLYSILV